MYRSGLYEFRSIELYKPSSTPAQRYHTDSEFSWWDSCCAMIDIESQKPSGRIIPGSRPFNFTGLAFRSKRRSQVYETNLEQGLNLKRQNIRFNHLWISFSHFSLFSVLRYSSQWRISVLLGRVCPGPPTSTSISFDIQYFLTCPPSFPFSTAPIQMSLRTFLYISLFTHISSVLISTPSPLWWSVHCCCYEVDKSGICLRQRCEGIPPSWGEELYFCEQNFRDSAGAETSLVDRPEWCVHALHGPTEALLNRSAVIIFTAAGILPRNICTTSHL